MYAKMDIEEDVEVNATALNVVLHGLKQERDNWRITMAEPDASSRELGETMAMDIDFVRKLLSRFSPFSIHRH